MIRVVCAPYHLGRHRDGMGAGPERLLAAGAPDRLRSAGREVEVVEVDAPRPVGHETGAYFAVQTSLARATAQAVDAGAFPLVLGGDCGCVLGVTAGLGRESRTGVVWFDAHGDANTPESTVSGFLDGMAVAVLTGLCWQGLAGAVPGFGPVPGDQVLLAGVRSVDPQERRVIEAAGIPVVGPAGLGPSGDSPFVRALDALAARVHSVHVHVDLDVIDPGDGVANGFAVDGGPSLAALTASVEAIGAAVPVHSVSLTSYDPAHDADGRAAASALRLLDSLAALAPPG
ncbi:arginase family protein [Isoptericola sp. NPDC057391]|uniref:arginase family protein n=1 Tax=Isoptericola sp. NPDC057391 TaxID=3346117 RepID=UPI0036304376